MSPKQGDGLLGGLDLEPPIERFLSRSRRKHPLRPVDRVCRAGSAAELHELACPFSSAEVAHRQVTPRRSAPTGAQGRDAGRPRQDRRRDCGALHTPLAARASTNSLLVARA